MGSGVAIIVSRTITGRKCGFTGVIADAFDVVVVVGVITTQTTDYLTDATKQPTSTCSGGGKMSRLIATRYCCCPIGEKSNKLY